jgi:hypothetical protein
MIDLPPAPARIARLPKDRRGYPVPWFLEWMKDGNPASPNDAGAQPDFRIIKYRAREHAWIKKFCWICGEPMGVHRVYVIGPMCVVNRTTMEPPCHRDCAEYAAKACPFLVRPRMRRLPQDDLVFASGGLRIDGEMIPRNPGACCLYEARDATPFRDGKGGWLIRLGAPARVDWWAQGRQATHDEIFESITSGLPNLVELAELEGPEAKAELARLTVQALKLLPAA